MATTAMDYEAANGDRYDEDSHRYERDNRSASPRPTRDDAGSRRRSASPAGNPDVGSKDAPGAKDDDDGAVNPGSNLFVTGIHPRLAESDISKLFEKYGDVVRTEIMRDPHTKESRGFCFVMMETREQADAAREGLQGEVLEGRTLSIEKARRARGRDPTPGRYFGPRKADLRQRFDDRRRGGSSNMGSYGRDDSYRYRGGERGYDRTYDRGYDRRYDDRNYDRNYREERRYDDRSHGRDYERGYGRRDRDDGYGRERYPSGRDDRDRYGGRSGGGGGSGSGSGYERDRYERQGDRDSGRLRESATGGGPAYGEAASRSEPREQYGGPDPSMH